MHRAAAGDQKDMPDAVLGQTLHDIVGKFDHGIQSTEGSTLFSEDLEFVLERTEHLWGAMAGESLFLTGGTGFFGRWLTETFDYANRRLGLRANRLTLSRREIADPRYWKGDIRSFPFPPGRFRYLIHAALDSGDLTTSTEGTRHVAEFAVEAGVERWLFTSSGAAYRPETALGAAKIEAERSARGAAIARCYSFVGPYLPLDRTYAAGNFLLDKLLGRPIRIHGDGSTVRSYLYAPELAVHLWTLLFTGVPGEIYEVGSREPVSIAQLAALFRHPVEYLNQPVPQTVYLPRHGLLAEIPLDAALARTERWYRTQLAR